MPTILTHAALPLIAAWALGPKRVPPRLAAMGALLAVAPDLDVIGRAFDIPHTAPLGHRGVSHSLAAAALLALLGMAVSARDRRWRSFAFLFAAASSHGLTDMLTDGGKGIMLWWPLSNVRYAWMERPVEVSGILGRSIADGRLPAILWSELLWLVAPALLLALLVRLVTATHIDLDKGQS
ncbi:MAG TPA: metal-dependent hydrolase [Sphingomicrobium sp.]|nr:metal-dependent hydrolase [Sphingomicrobium sp.]